MASEDKQAFVATVAARHGGNVRRFLSAKLRHAVADVPDLVQEVFLRLLRVNNPETIRSPEAYLFTIARHVLQQHQARRSSAPEIVDLNDVLAEFESVPDAAVDPVTRLQSRQRMEELERIMPYKAYATLVLHRVCGMTLEKIGEELGVSRPMVKKYLARALTHCRQYEEFVE